MRAPIRALPLLLLLPVLHAAAQSPGAAEKSNMELVGVDALQARSAYQPTILRQGERWILYVGHHGGRSPNPPIGAVAESGTSLPFNTDPRRPKAPSAIPGQPGQGATGGPPMARAC